MADEEIQISELEFRENLSGDDLLPVETSTDTFATSLTKIKDWLKSFFVNKTDNEEIGGKKYFNSNATVARNIYTSSSTLKKGENPSSNASWGISFDDRTAYTEDNWRKRRLGLLEINVSPTGTSKLSLGAYENTEESTNSSVLSIFLDKPNDGKKYVTCPGSDIINSVVTTTGISKTENGYVKLGNGLIIQWGKGSGTSIITFPTPFSSGNYGISILNNGPTGSAYPVYKFQSATATTVNINASSSGDFRWLAIGY